MSFRGKEKQDPPLGEKISIYTPKPTGSSSRFKIPWILVLITIWLLTIQYFERVVPKNALKSCQWDKWESWPKGATPHRIAIVADPQIVDGNTYPNQSFIFNHYIKRVSDTYLQRNHKYMNAFLDPDTTIFLGDLFDGGREWDDDGVWLDEYKRFTKIFPQPQNRRTIRSVPGNHDIGFQTIKTSVQGRFSAFFGDPNQYIELGNHTIMLVDTISLSHEDPNVNREARDFVKKLPERLEHPENPRILFSHVPLYRFNDRQLCGPLREKKGKFPVQRGYQYQTVLEYHISQQLLTTLDPDLIFSGDDHDYCHIKHEYETKTPRVAHEISVKTASMTCGVNYPAIQLLSLYHPYEPLQKNVKERTDTYQTKMCYLGAPYRAIKVYWLLYLVSVGVFALTFIWPRSVIRWTKNLTHNHKHNAAPFKDINSNAWAALGNFITNNLQPERDLVAFGISTTIITVSVYVIFILYGKFI